MPQRIPRRPRRVSFKRRARRYFRKTKMTRAVRPRSVEFHRFKRSTLLFGVNGVINTTIATSSGAGLGFYSVGFNNLLSQTPQYSELSELYDQYKLDYVVYRVNWLATERSDIATSSAGPPVLYWVIDRDDVTAYPSSDAGLQDIRANSHCKRFAFDSGKRECVIKFKPNTLVETYNNGITSGYTLQFNKWIDMAYPSLQYWGTKMFFHTPSVAGTPNGVNYFEVVATYYISCRNPR